MAVVSYIIQAAWWLVILALCLASVGSVLYLAGAVILQAVSSARRLRRG